MQPQAADILIVDDEPGMRKTLGRILKARGFRVRLAEDGADAVRQACDAAPDVVLLDIRMPGLDGVDTWCRIRQECPTARVIFMTGHASDERKQAARDAGALEVFSKPLDPAAVHDRIVQALLPILIIDDDPAFVSSLRRALAKLSFDVGTASSEEEALQYLQGARRGVAVLDMRLEGSSGLRMLELIRGQSPEMMVILMSGYSESAGDMQTGLQRGAVMTLTKPFDPEQLAGEIRRRAENSHAV